MDARNFNFMFYGFTAAWVIVLIYVISLARRGARLKKELQDVKQLVSSTQSENASGKAGSFESAESRSRQRV